MIVLAKLAVIAALGFVIARTLWDLRQPAVSEWREDHVPLTRERRRSLHAEAARQAHMLHVTEGIDS